MTRRLVITNLSNWGNEDYAIELNGKQVHLAPGESAELGDDVLPTGPIPEPTTVLITPNMGAGYDGHEPVELKVVMPFGKTPE